MFCYISLTLETHKINKYLYYNNCINNVNFCFIIYIIITPSGKMFVHFVTESTVTTDTNNL